MNYEQSFEQSPAVDGEICAAAAISMQSIPEGNESALFDSSVSIGSPIPVRSINEQIEKYEESETSILAVKQHRTPA